MPRELRCWILQMICASFYGIFCFYGIPVETSGKLQVKGEGRVIFLETIQTWETRHDILKYMESYHRLLPGILFDRVIVSDPQQRYSQFYKESPKMWGSYWKPKKTLMKLN